MSVRTKTTIVLSSIAAVMLFTGCSIHQEVLGQINDIKNNKSNDIVLNGTKMPNIIDGYNHDIKKREFFTIQNPMSVSRALLELQKIDGKRYHLHKDEDDITIPSNSMTIKTFNDLTMCLEDLLEKNIYVSKNKGFKNRLKIVKIRDMREKELNLENVTFSINENMPVSEALRTLQSKKDFKFSINIKSEEFEGKLNASTRNKFFDNVMLMYKGGTVGNFFEYLQEKLNVFIDVDYENKIVNISKYKQEFFQLTTGNVQISGTLGNADTQVTDSSGSAQSSSLNQEVDINIAEEAKKALDVYIQKSKDTGNKNSTVDVDSQSGTITAYADRETIKKIQEKIKRINADYKDNIEVEIFSFELVLNKNYGFESGATISNKGNSTSQEFNINNVLENVVGTFSKVNPNGLSYSLLINSLDEYGYIANRIVKKYTLRNHIPKSLSAQETERYLKDIRIVDPSTDSDTAKTQSETAELREPQKYDVTAHYSDGYISIDLAVSEGKKVSMGELVVSEDTKVSNPKTQSRNSTSNLYIKDGDFIVTAKEQEVDSSKNYKSVIPGDMLITKVFGGGIDDGYVYKNRITIVTARKIKDI